MPSEVFPSQYVAAPSQVLVNGSHEVRSASASMAVRALWRQALRSPVNQMFTLRRHAAAAGPDGNPSWKGPAAGAVAASSIQGATSSALPLPIATTALATHRRASPRRTSRGSALNHASTVWWPPVYESGRHDDATSSTASVRSPAAIVCRIASEVSPRSRSHRPARRLTSTTRSGSVNWSSLRKRSRNRW